MPALSPSSDPGPSFDPSAETTRQPDALDAGASEPARVRGLTCPVCGTPAGPGARFCEIDGTVLGVCVCVDGGDGFCANCGMKMATVCSPGRRLGAATHVGVSHDTNQDAVGVDCRGDMDVIVVCDGVSSSSHGERASAEAAAAALASLVAAVEDAAGTRPLDPEAALHDAVRAAHRAACDAKIEVEVGMDPPGTTFVAAILQRGTDANRIDVAWVGDSRAYLVAPESALALTHDHSFVNMMVDAGAMTESEAMRSPYAHAITHCMGPLESTDPEQAPNPSLAHAEAGAGTKLVVCTDGLWNYFPGPDDIAALFNSVPAGADAATAAVVLVNRALAMGGHDDVTVALAFIRPPTA